jgi:hypothetical protein
MSSLPSAMRDRNAVLVVAHPGHELRVHHWLELAKPTVWVLTDGSGHGDRGRVASSASTVTRAGGEPGAVFGAFTDRDAYRLLLQGQTGPWIEVVESLARTLLDERIGYVLADAVEGFNPIHDLCRVVADGAVAIAERSGATIARYGFTLEAPPDAVVPGLLREAVVIELDDEAVERKIAAARGYPEMAAEVERALAAYGTAAFRREHLRRTDPEAKPERFFAAPPHYEKHGERQVERGFYDRVLRFREHFLPAAEAVARHVAAAAAPV